MNHFKSEDKLSKLIHENHFLLPVINRFGIRLGFKDKTVVQVCGEQNINENFFLTIVNTYTNEDYFPEAELLKFSPQLIVDYLRKTHKYYFEYLFPEVERCLEKVLASCETKCEDLQLIKKFYEKYKFELSKHIEDEEENVFPYVRAITETYEKGTPLSDAFKSYNIHSAEQEHTRVDQKIYDLKTIILKYLEPAYNDNDCNAFLFAIFQFEKDLLDHARIEDKILVHRVMDIEKSVKHG